MSKRLTAERMNNLVAKYERYFRHEKRKSEATVKRYMPIVEEFAAFLVEYYGPQNILLTSVEKSHISEFMQRQGVEGKARAKSSFNVRLAALRSFFDYLFKEELVAVNPAKRIDRLTVIPDDPDPPTMDEYLDLIETIERRSPPEQRARNVGLVEVAFHNSFRVAELRSLNVSSTQLDEHVFKNVRRKGDKKLSLEFSDHVATVLERVIAERSKLKPAQGEDALFLSNRGVRMSVRAMQAMFGRYAKLAGIKRHVSPHTFRHSSVSERTNLGIDLRVSQSICGHAEITTTQRYSHVHRSARVEAAAKLAAAVRRRKRERDKRRREIGRRSA